MCFMTTGYIRKDLYNYCQIIDSIIAREGEYMDTKLLRENFKTYEGVF